jgi:adenosylmethionine-8-amino-7-oxononanoate aminotransferase
MMPPYVITEEQIDFLAEVAAEGIDIATGNGHRSA